MTRISIVGGGPAATLHAEAVRATPGAELVGVGGRPGSAATLAAGLAVPDLPLDELVDEADALIVAVPPSAVAEVVSLAHGRVAALLIESPVATTVADAAALAGPTPVMTGANLLHAPAVRRGLQAIAEMSAPHHLVMRATGPRPSWGAHATPAFGAGAILDPGARLLPVLLAAAGVPVTAVSATLSHTAGIDHHADLDLQLTDGRIARAAIVWQEGETSAELEVADATGVVSLRLLPGPALELDGSPAASDDTDPLTALGFVEQIRRLTAVARGDAEPWAALGAGVGVLTVAAAAAQSGWRGGDLVECAHANLAASPSTIMSAA